MPWSIQLLFQAFGPYELLCIYTSMHVSCHKEDKDNHKEVYISESIIQAFIICLCFQLCLHRGFVWIQRCQTFSFWSLCIKRLVHRVVYCISLYCLCPLYAIPILIYEIFHLSAILIIQY